VFLRPIRPFLAVLGLGFHAVHGEPLWISLELLAPAYIALIDWTAVARGAWRRHAPAPLVVLYDSQCGLCRRAMAVVRALDVLDAIAAVPGVASDPRRRRYSEITDAMLAHDLYAIGEAKTVHGYDAWVAIARRIPLLWPAVPLLGLGAVARTGRRFYRRIADSRRCALPRPGRPERTSGPDSLIWIAVIGGVLVAWEIAVSMQKLACIKGE